MRVQIDWPGCISSSVWQRPGETKRRALVGDQYGPSPPPTRIEEKEWEALRAQLTSRPRDLDLLSRSYGRDADARPPCYLLQPPAPGEAHGPEEADLGSVLHAAAQDAHRLGLLSQEQCGRYRSVLERELELGVLGPAAEGTTVFLREIPELDRHLLDECSLRLVDRRPDGCLDEEAQARLRVLKARLAAAHPEVLKAHPVAWSRDLVNPANKAHSRYLLGLAGQLVARLNHQVLERLRAGEAASPWEPTWLLEDIRHHLNLAAEHARGFCGRRELLADLGRRLRETDGVPHLPLVLRGPPGVGVTALLCVLAGAGSRLLGRPAVVVLRLLGASGPSRDGRVVLAGLCRQLCLAFGLPPPPPAILQARARLVPFLRELLLSISARRFESLLLLLDVPGLPQAPHWLPALCPPRVHVLLAAGPGALNGDHQEPWEVGPLPAAKACEMLQGLLGAAGRTLDPGQEAALGAGLPHGGHPGRLRLGLQEAGDCASFCAATPLPAEPLEAAHQLCAHLERRHGPVLTAAVLGSLAAARFGLSEAELKDVLSVDDEVLGAVYREWTPPSREVLRFPPLLWVRLRRDLGTSLARRPWGGCTLLALGSSLLERVARERYLAGPDKAKRHGILADFFSGAWSQGTKKLITLPLMGKPLNLDRKVAPQPLWFSEEVGNERKLEELPFHLLHAGRTQELMGEVLGSLDWLCCRGMSGGLDTLLDDLGLCAPHVDCPELELVREALELSRPALELRGLEKGVLCTELLARLHFFAASHPVLVGPLCQQAQSWFRLCPNPMLVPLAGFLQPPGGPLWATFTGCHKGISALAWSVEESLLVVGTLDGFIVVWDVAERQVTHVLAGHSGEVHHLQVFAQGTQALSASRDQTLRVWELRSGRERLSLWGGGAQDAAEPRLWSLQVDETRRAVCSASVSKVTAWSLDTGELLFRILSDPADPWLCAAHLVSPASLLTVSEQGVVGRWSPASGQLRGKRRLSCVRGEAPTCGVPVQTQGWLVAGFSQGSVALVSTEGDSLLEKLPEAVRFLVVSEDDSFLAAAFGRSVWVFLADAQGFRRFTDTELEHEAVVEAAVFGPENNLIVTASRDRLVQVWSLSEQGALLAVLEGLGSPGGLLARGGALVAAACRVSSSLRVWDLSRLAPPGLPAPFPDRSGLATPSHDGRFVYFPRPGDKTKVSVWDVAQGEEQAVLDAPSPVCCLEVAARAGLLFAGLASGALLVFTLVGGPGGEPEQDVLCLPPPAGPPGPLLGLALAPSEDTLALAYGAAVLLLEVAPGPPCPRLGVPLELRPTAPPVSLAPLAGPRLLYSPAAGGLFLLAEPGTPKPLADGGPLACLCVSHGEQMAAGGASDGGLRLWDLESGACTLSIHYQSSYCPGVQNLCFSLDDKLVFAGMRDRSVTVWSALDGSLLASQFLHAELTRIVPTPGGFLAPSRHGYLVRERYQCPSARASPQVPLRHFQKAVWMVKSLQRRGLAAAGDRGARDGEPGSSGQRDPKSNKRSQVCLLV
ncbi:NACHT domain- and WD repeat-containing protein 1 [Erinaceus europaeus]|uniref:NACHT domain- and WD repeat-containing protein 1 n=1 Tax=Erinaceus europaeus TaxID=9365 RepID=A0ABM3WLF2_ERIEU|nr:NACHT domain- and WD repeat-containing protein 1 [Erinaceus europaeus]